MSTPRTRRWGTLALVVMAAATAACSPTSSTARLSGDVAGTGDWSGIVVSPPIEKPDLVVTTGTGTQFDLRQATAGVPTLLFFGYTSCPDICPVQLGNLAAAMNETGVTTDEINVVFVSVDPARDTPQTVSDYVHHFDPGFIGVTGGAAAVEAAIAALDFPAPTFGEPDETGYYTVGHPAQVIAFGTDALAPLESPFGIRQSQWSKDLPRLAAGEHP